MESQLAAWLLSIQERLQAIPLTYSTTRTWGSFTPINLPEVLAALAALASELEAVAASAHVGGVLRDYERVEQLLAGVTRSMKVWYLCRSAAERACPARKAPMTQSSCPGGILRLGSL